MPRWSAAPSTPPSGSVPTTTRSSDSIRLRSTTTTPAGGKAGHDHADHQCAAYDALPQLYKEALDAACAEQNVMMMAKYDAKNPEALRRLVAAGVQLRQFPRPVLDACYKATFETYDELAAKNDEFKKIYASWRNFLPIPISGSDSQRTISTTIATSWRRSSASTYRAPLAICKPQTESPKRHDNGGSCRGGFKTRPRFAFTGCRRDNSFAQSLCTTGGFKTAPTSVPIVMCLLLENT